MIEKLCPDCREVKPVAEFYSSSSRPDGLHSCCRTCASERNRLARFRNHGITEVEFDEMVERQRGLCAVCSQEPMLVGNVLWAIDHDHSCCPGRYSCGDCVRGLLCCACNRGLGNFDDDVDRLMAAAAYLLSTRNILTEVSS